MIRLVEHATGKQYVQKASKGLFLTHFGNAMLHQDRMRIGMIKAICQIMELGVHGVQMQAHKAYLPQEANILIIWMQI